MHQIIIKSFYQASIRCIN